MEEQNNNKFEKSVRMLSRKLCKRSLNENIWTKGDQRKWMKGVLMGNWFEDSLQGLRASCDTPHFARATEYRCKYMPHLEFPDFMIKYENKIKFTEGKPKDFGLGHFDRCYSKYMITTYDEHIGRRERPCDQMFPCLRTRNFTRNAWLPEKNDHPLMGTPTNWGLLDMKRQELLKEVGLIRDSSKKMITTYQATFSRPANEICSSR